MEEKGSMTRMLLVMAFTSCKMIPMECVRPAVAGGEETHMRWGGGSGVVRDLSPSPEGLATPQCHRPFSPKWPFYNQFAFSEELI